MHKHFLRQLALWLVVLLPAFPCVPAGASAETVTLADNGTSDYAIVVGRSAYDTPRFAARELQAYLEKATGARLPVVNRPLPQKHSIFVGESTFTKAKGIVTDGLPPEGFLIKTHQADLYIMGRDTRGKPLYMNWTLCARTGTLYAVYDFLERYLGVRWLFPGGLGEVVPRRRVLTLGPVSIREQPAFVHRYLQPARMRSKDVRLWLRRNRIGRSFVFNKAHNWAYVMPLPGAKKTWPKWKYRGMPYLSHPEYYALVNGKRVHTYNSQNRHGGQVCTSNPEVISLFAEAANDWFDKNPEMDSFSLMPNDGAGFCECNQCRALDVARRADGKPVLTDRMFTFYNAVARLVQEKHPDKYLSAGAYIYYRTPPEKVIPARNLCINYVHGNALFKANSTIAARRLGEIKQWTALNDHVVLTTWHTGAGLWDMPLSTVPETARLLRSFKSLGGIGFFYHTLMSPGSGALENYIAARMMWDPDLDLEKLLEQYYTSSYGPESGSCIRRYHELLHGALASFTNNNTLRIRHETPRGVTRLRKREMIVPLYAGIRQTARDLLDRAVGCAGAGKQAERARIVSENFRFVELTLDALDAHKRLKAHRSAGNLLAFKHAVDARESFIEAYGGTPVIDGKRVRTNDKNYRIRITPATVRRLLPAAP